MLILGISTTIELLSLNITAFAHYMCIYRLSEDHSGILAHCDVILISNPSSEYFCKIILFRKMCPIINGQRNRGIMFRGQCPARRGRREELVPSPEHVNMSNPLRTFSLIYESAGIYPCSVNSPYRNALLCHFRLVKGV